MPARTTIKDIAHAVGVHHATVSRALRDDPRIASATVERVKRAAAQLGYAPDPMMRALAVYRTGLRPVEFKETLAYIWPEATPGDVAKFPYLARSINAARSHASLLGYSMDEFFLTQQDAQSVQRILRARGIRGAVIGAASHAEKLLIPLDFTGLAFAALSSTLMNPRLHRAGHDHFNGMQIALQKVSELGYRKVAFLTGAEQERILNQKYTGAFLEHHPLGPEAAHGLMRTVSVPGKEAIEETLRTLRPDCLIVTYTPVPLPRQSGKLVPVVSLDVLPEDVRVAGIYQQTALAAAAAVDFVIEQIHHGKRGIPAERKNMLTDGQWFDHPSCPPVSQIGAKPAESKSSAKPTKRAPTRRPPQKPPS